MIRKLVAFTAAALLTAPLAMVASPALATIDPTHAPPVPAAPAITASGDSVTVHWKTVRHATGYLARISLNGGRWGDSALLGASASKVTFEDLRSGSLGCHWGPCSVVVEVESIRGPYESGWSAPSNRVSLPVPYRIKLQSFRTKWPHRTVLYLFGPASRPGETIHLQTVNRFGVWKNVRVTTTRVQTLPGSHPRTELAWLFKIVVRGYGLTNFRVHVPATATRGEGLSRPFGVLR